MECAPKTIGVLIDDLSAIREKRRVLVIQDKVLEDQYKALEATIKEQLTENGMSLASGTSGVGLAQLSSRRRGD